MSGTVEAPDATLWLYHHVDARMWRMVGLYLRALEARARWPRLACPGPLSTLPASLLAPAPKPPGPSPRAPLPAWARPRPPAPPAWHDPGVRWVHRGHGWVAELRRDPRVQGPPSPWPLAAVSRREIDGGPGGGWKSATRYTRDRLPTENVEDVCRSCAVAGPWWSMERIRWVEDGVEDCRVLCPTCAGGVPALAVHRGVYVAGEPPGGDAVC